MTTSKQNIQFIDFYTYVMYTFTRHTSDLSSLSNWNLVFISVFQDNRVKKLKDSEVSLWHCTFLSAVRIFTDIAGLLVIVISIFI